jgi:23S rRNA pseudouridine1911/1915/1917 synthase
MVPEELDRKPLDAAVRALFAASWGDARAWIESGKIAVDGEQVTDRAARVRASQEVSLSMNAPRPRAENALAKEQLVFVDAQVVVVNKPSGVSTVPYADEDPESTLDARVRAFLARGGPRPSLGVVHRIDKETSGLVVFTRTWSAKKSLASQFRAHTVHRRYLAIVHGDVRARTIRSHLVEDRGDGLRGSIEAIKHRRGPRAQGQLAITHVEPIESLGGRATLVACRLETGRTHQIRIHMSEAGHPIVGERVYIRGFSSAIVAPRLMLHAAELGFVHPATNREMKWTADPPADFNAVLARLRRATV